MTMRNSGWRRCLRAVLIAAGGLLATGIARAEITAMVTSVEGQANVGEAPVAVHSRLPTDESLETAPGASCSLLVDFDSVVQFCGEASLRVREHDQGEGTVVRLDEGSFKATVGPRPADAPFEIHTPVAVAVILGTVVSTTVDPATGDTTFAVEEGVVRVTSSDPSIGGETTLHAGESITVRRGQPPEAAQRLDTVQVVDCLGNALFRASALRGDRAEREREATDTIVAADIGGLLPPVAAPPALGIELPDNPWADDLPPGCTPVLCEQSVPTRVTQPGPCSGIPGDHCTF
jgi:hypothetical protein